MPVDPKLVPKRDRKYLDQLARWREGGPAFYNVLREAVDADTLAHNAKRFAKTIDRVNESLTRPVNHTLKWDMRTAQYSGRMQAAAMQYLFTGDENLLDHAAGALDRLLKHPESCFCYSTCRGHQWVDLRTAAVLEAAALMEFSFGDVMPTKLRKKVSNTAINRGLLEGLKGLDTRKFSWTWRVMNWRNVMTGSLAFAAMAFLPERDEAHELLGYALEGALAIMADGDRAGGWNEGPGYWEYGIGHLAQYAFFLRTVTAGKVDLFSHPYLKHTGDFRLAMTVKPGQVWNWSDAHKHVGPSALLAMLSRVYRRGDYLDLVLSEGVAGHWQLYYLDPSVKRERQRDVPTTAHFPDLGVFAMRSGSAKTSNYVGVKAGIVGQGIGHQHMDPGSLVVFSHGRELLAELNPWAYAQATGKAGGFFDRTCHRWDYDYCGSIGHNVAIVGTPYRKWTYEGKARVLSHDADAKRSVVAMDTSKLYDEPVKRARRAIVTLFPDLTLVIDDITASEAVRASTLWHYEGKVTVDDESFTIRSGSAELHAQSLTPSLFDNIILGHDERKVHYHTERGEVDHVNRYVYIQNLHRAKRLTFVCAMHYGKRPLPDVAWEYKPTGDGAGVITAKRGRRKHKVTFDLNKGVVS